MTRKTFLSVAVFFFFLEDSFDKFFSSSCHTIILVYDVVEIEVYSKESGYLEQCRKDLGCLKGCVNVEEIQADSCFRDDFVI